MRIKNQCTWLLVFVFLMMGYASHAQLQETTQWAPDGYRFYTIQNDEIVLRDVRDMSRSTIIMTKAMLTPAGHAALIPKRFSISADGNKILLNTNTRKVWRYDTRGDYWVFDLQSKTLKQLGKGKPESSLMFAKFSPDGTKAAYVSGHNIYMENLATGTIKPLTTDGTQKLINGTFDWVYEEEFDCRDGFRWSPDGKSIAYWQIDASKIKNYLMLNTTDSTYSFVVPVEYPVAGEDPSLCKVGVVNIATAKTKWMNVPGDAIQHYIPRMQWADNSSELILQQLNRSQNDSKLFIVNAATGAARTVCEEQNKAWIDAPEDQSWKWLDGGQKFVWLSEKDGWKHIYTIDRDGREKLITKGDYDVISVKLIDEADKLIYFMASPANATQQYLYSISLNGGEATKVSPADEPGTHDYDIIPNGKMAWHSFSNSNTQPVGEVVSLPMHQHISGSVIKANTIPAKGSPEFFKVKTADGVEMDGWMIKPTNFDPAKKYPVVFYVYGEPAAQTVTDEYGIGRNREYIGNMADDGYIYMSLDNRGAPAPKGREWRKSIYKSIGTLNIRDQAMAAKEILKWPFVDSSRIAVWGWSGGGSSTLNLMFQYPDIYKTGIAIASVTNPLSYDDIYQERYMGVPKDEESRAPYIKGSAITYAKNLKGNLLYIHGTGDDNVHYSNAELLINELVKYNRQFQLMIYPNRTHSLSEGEGTTKHLQTLFTQYLKEHCPPGGR